MSRSTYMINNNEYGYKMERLMKTTFTLIFLFLSTSLAAQEQITLFYFGATSCAPCNRPDVIESINTIRAEIDSVHSDYRVKLVMVSLDQDIETGYRYLQKYDYWDEVSIGTFYHNEHNLSHLNKTDLPGVPHIMIYKDEFSDTGRGIQIIKKRISLINILGGDNIVTWVEEGMELAIKN